MKMSPTKLKISMARSCFDVTDLSTAAKLAKNTIKAALAGKEVKPKTVGKIAKALNCDVSEILEEVE